MKGRMNVSENKDTGGHGRFSRKEFLGLGAGAAGLAILGGCGSAGGAASNSSGNKTLSLSYITWDEDVANSNVIKAIAENDLGYKNVDLTLGDVGPVFQSVAKGDADAFLDAWMPGHQEYLNKVGKGAVLLKDPWYEGSTQYGIAVPDYMKNVKTISDLNKSGADAITGIEPGALLMDRIKNNVIPEYNLKLKLLSSGTAAMLAALERAYKRKEPFVFLGWSPHWMNAKYDFHYLKDPKDAMGNIDDPATLHAVVNKDFKSKDPVGYALINAMRFTKPQMDELELMINKKGKNDPMKGAKAWIKENRNVVEPWIKAAKKAKKA